MRSFIRPPQAISGLKSALSGLKSTLSGLKSALSGLESARAVFGQRPRRGRCPVEHRGTFVHPFVRLSERADSRPEKAYLRSDRVNFSPERADFRPERAWGRRTDKRTNKSPPVFYRTSSPSGPLPCFPSLQLTIRQSRATGIADHILPLGDLFFTKTLRKSTPPGPSPFFR